MVWRKLDQRNGRFRRAKLGPRKKFDARAEFHSCGTVFDISVKFYQKSKCDGSNQLFIHWFGGVDVVTFFDWRPLKKVGKKLSGELNFTRMGLVQRSKVPTHSGPD